MPRSQRTIFFFVLLLVMFVTECLQKKYAIPTVVNFVSGVKTLIVLFMAMLMAFIQF